MIQVSHPELLTTLRLRKAGGNLLSPVVGLFCEEESAGWGFVVYRRRPFRAGLSIVLGILTFFAFPVVVGLSMMWLTQQLGVENPLGLDRRQSVTLAVILWILIVTTGFLATMLVIRLTAPRLHLRIFHDPECRDLLLELRQTNLNLFPTVQISLTDEWDQPLGFLRRHQTRDQLELLDHDQNRLAMVLPGLVEEPSLNPGRILLFFAGLAVSFFFWFPVFAFSDQNPVKHYQLWSFIPGEAAGRNVIAWLEIHPGDRTQNQIEITGQLTDPLHRQLLMALLAVLSAE